MRQPESSRRQKRLDVLHIDRCPKEAVVTLLFVFLPKQLTCGQPQYSVTRRKKSRTVIRDQEMSRFSAMMIFLTASVLLVLVPTSRAGAGWEYKGPLGPDQWHTEYPDCAGRVQSPINIDTAKVLYDPDLQYFDFKQYKKCNNCTMELENVAGHTAEVSFHGQPIIIKGGSLPDEYVLDQFHFHWGENASFGSEHKVDMKSAPLEMHIVHHMKRFAANESATHPYGLAVLGFFFEVTWQSPYDSHA
ncbi:carbonic anhydrase 14-like [Littorina saxatilis]|uniref:carbonic anhydrase 14-like n=1 Tax=Littorina saxatilis TaxID=31220 RepID=UPI0038B57B59